MTSSIWRSNIDFAGGVPTDHPTICTGRHLLHPPESRERSLKDLIQFLDDAAAEMRNRRNLHVCGVVAGHNPRSCPTINNNYQIVDYPDCSELLPIDVTTADRPVVIYRNGFEMNGTGDLDRVMLPHVVQRQAHYIRTDTDGQFPLKVTLDMADAALARSAESGKHSVAFAERLIRYSPYELGRKAVEAVHAAFSRIALRDSFDEDHLRALWAGCYPVRDGLQSSTFFYSFGILAEVLEDPMLRRYFNTHEGQPIWTSDLLLNHVVISLAARDPAQYEILTFPLNPETDEGQRDVGDDIVAEQVLDLQEALGISLRRVKNEMSGDHSAYLPVDVLAPLNFSTPEIDRLLSQVFGRLRHDAREIVHRQEKSKWERNMVLEWSQRALRPGDYAVTSNRYPPEEFEEASAAYVSEVLDFIGNDLAGKTVLEVGAGNGRLTEHLVDRAEELTAVDIIESMLQRNRQRLGNKAGTVKYVRGLAQETSGHFDVVISSLVLIHNVPDFAFNGLTSAMASSGDVLFIFENTKSCFERSRHTVLRSRDELVAAFPGFHIIKETSHFVFEDEIVFLKLERHPSHSAPPASREPRRSESDR